MYMYLHVRSPLIEKSYFAQNWTYTLFALSGQFTATGPKGILSLKGNA